MTQYPEPYRTPTPLSSTTQVIAVASGKGGVGKTNISVNLAVCLAQSGQRVTLVDADMSLGNLDVLLNIHSKYNISHVVSGRKQIEEVLHPGPLGINVICGASGLEKLANLGDFQRTRLVQQLSRLHDLSDVIIIDSAAGIAKPVVAFCLASDHTLVVTTPEATAMTDAYSMIKVLAKNNFTGRLSLVVNMTDNIKQGQKIYRQMADVARHFLGVHIYCAAILVRDTCLPNAVRLRKPVVLASPKSRIALSLSQLSRKLAQHSACTDPQPFFHRVASWFS